MSFHRFLKTTAKKEKPELKYALQNRQEINIGPGKFGKKNKYRSMDNRRAWKIWQKFEVFVMKKLKKKYFPDF